MRTTQQMSITLPIAMAEQVKAKVESGQYSSESEVIRDGLRTLIERDAVVDAWLRDRVAMDLDELDTNPSSAMNGAQIRARLARRNQTNAAPHAKLPRRK